MEIFGMFFFVLGVVLVSLFVNTIKIRFKIPTFHMNIMRLLATMCIFGTFCTMYLTFKQGACTSWRMLGQLYTNGCSYLFLLSMPALLFLLASFRNRKNLIYWILAVIFVLIPFSFLVILEQYARTESLFGIDGNENPVDRCAHIPL